MARQPDDYRFRNPSQRHDNDHRPPASSHSNRRYGGDDDNPYNPYDTGRQGDLEDDRGGYYRSGYFGSERRAHRDGDPTRRDGGEPGYGRGSYGSSSFDEDEGMSGGRGDPDAHDDGLYGSRTGEDGGMVRRSIGGQGMGRRAGGMSGSSHGRYGSEHPGRAGGYGIGSGGHQGGMARGKGPKGYTRSEDRIREDVCDCLTDDAHLDAGEIEVQVKSGEVTLSGTVPDRSAKRHAEDIIEHVSGVKNVQNSLRIKEQQGLTGKSPGSHS